MTMVGQDPSAKYQDELQIQVEDKDLKITMMWSVEAFQDNLEMMRQAYAQHQNKLMSKTFDASIIKTVDKEVFNSNAAKTMTNFTAQFQVDPETSEDLEQFF